MSDKNAALKNLVSGLFFIVGLCLVFGMIFMIGKDKGFSQPKFEITVLFNDVGGLIEGAPVQLAGVNVGTVSDISFLDQRVKGRRIQVIVSVFDRYKNQLKRDVRFTIKTEGILGEKLIKVHSSEEGLQTDLSKPIIGEDSLNVQDLTQVFTDAAASFTKTSDDFNQADIQELSKVLADAAQSLADTSRGINMILSEMRYISVKSKRMLDRLEQRVIDGDLFKVF